MKASGDPSAWHGPGCTVVVTGTEGARGVGSPAVSARITDLPPVGSDSSRSLMVSVSVLFEGVDSSRSGGEGCQLTTVLDEAPPQSVCRRWVTHGDAGAAWDAIRALRLGDVDAAAASGVAASVDHDGVASMPLDRSSTGVPIGAPWFAWSNGLLACILAAGNDCGEPFWDIAVTWRDPMTHAWSIAYRASAYVASTRLQSGDDNKQTSTADASLASLAALPPIEPTRGGGLTRMADRAKPRTSGRPAESQASEVQPRLADAAAFGTRASADERSGSGLVTNDGSDVDQTGIAPRSRFLAQITRVIDDLDAIINRSRFGGPALPWTLFWLGLGVYVVTRLWGVYDYPLAFDGDEAAIVVLGRALLDSGFRDGYGIWFPLFFAYPNWNPDVGVYVHLLTSSLFGVSVTVARATAGLLSTLAPIALAAALRWGFGARGWWVAPYVLSALPIWFHLSRSAYDSATWVAFLACAVAAYYRYRFHDPHWAFHFVGALLLTFYSNTVAHLYVLLLGSVVLVVDWRYHLANWRALLAPMVVGFAGMLPLATFLSKNPGYFAQRLSSTHPHWGDGSKPLFETLYAQVRAAMISLHPMVWFVSENRGQYVDVTGYHNYYPGTMPLLPWWVGVLVAVGILVIWLPAFSGRRAVLLSLLALSIAPTAISRFAPTRSLAAVVPIVLLSVYWADAVLPKGRRVAFVAGGMALVVTTVSSFVTLGQALTTQSTRVQDYGGYGIQWGSKEVYALVNRRLRATTDARVMVTTDWTWGGHHFIKFFVDRKELMAGRVFLGSLETVLKSPEPWGPEILAILSPAQLQYLRERMRAGATDGTGSRVVEASVTDEIPHPDGSPGFVMVRLRESPNIRDILAAEKAAANRPTYTDMTVDGQVVRVGTTAIDDGFVEPVLNNAPNALVRFSGPNPTLVDVAYPTPRPVSSIRMVLGAGMWKVTAHLSGTTTGAVLDVSGTGVPDGPNSVVNLTIGGPPFQTRRIVYEILQLNATEDDSTVHVYSLEVGR